MRPPFEIWAPSHIARLRADADALERTLAAYLAETERDSPAPVVVPLKPTPPHSPKPNTEGGGRPSKHGHILDMVLKAGPTGLTTDEIEQAAEAAGRPILRNSLRSFLWTQRQDGRMFQENGRHVSSKFKVAGEPEGTPSNSPDLLEGAA